MNKIIFIFAFLFTSFSLFAQSTRYDVLDSEKEIWVYPTVEVKLDVVFSNVGVDHFIVAKLNSYSSIRNTTNIEKLERLYPDYTIRLYPVVLKHGSIDFVGEDRIEFEASGIEASTKLTKIPLDSKEDILDQIYSMNDLLNIRLMNIKGAKEKEYSPNLDVNISIFSY